MNQTSSNAPLSRNVSEIIPRLLISDLAFAENATCLSQYQITHILSILPEKVYQPPVSLLPVQPARMQIPVEDFPFAELAAHLSRTTAWIQDALSRDPNSCVLVHCVEGISRSTSVVAAFLMAQYNWSPQEAVQYIKSKRKVTNPNLGFIQQLHEYGKGLHGRRQP